MPTSRVPLGEGATEARASRVFRKVYRGECHFLTRPGVLAADAIDVRILRLLLQGASTSPLNPDFRGAYSAIASAIGVDEDTVRHRAKNFGESGFLRDWRLQVNPRIWGGGQVAIFFDWDANAPKDDVVEELKLVPGSILVTSFQSRIAVIVGFDEEVTLPRQTELVRRLSGSETVWVGRYPFPPCSIDLSARDWDLVRALRDDPRKSRPALSRELGVSPRTISRRLERLAHGGVAFAFPSLDPRGIRGGVLASLYVTCRLDRQPELDKLLSAKLEPHHWHTSLMLPYQPGDPAVTGYELALPNISTIRDILSWARRLAGVEAARVDLYEDIFTNVQAYDDYLDGKLRSMPTTRPAVTMAAGRTPMKASKPLPRRPRRRAVKNAVRWSGT